MPFRRDPLHAKTLAADGLQEAPRRVPIRSDVDVLVCGGGPAGVGAALAAAREGARTLLIERWGTLGGVWTAGLLNPFFECHGRGYLVDELVTRLQAEGAWRRWKFSWTFDCEQMAYLLETMAAEVGLEVLLYSYVVDSIVEQGRVRGVVIESKAGREAITAQTVIDATGDGDVAARSGCSYEYGREVDGLCQPMTLMFELRGLPDWEQRDAEELFDLLTGAIAQHDLPFRLAVERCNYAPWIINLPTPGTAAVQLTHVYRLNALDPRDLTRGTIDARRQAVEAVATLRRVHGFEQVELARTAPAIGVREARRPLGRYRLTLDDLTAGARFDDAVTACAFGVDIHEPAPGAGVPSGHHAPMKPYEIPFRCQLPAEVEGLLLAGRCISGSHEAHASYRVTGTAMATGQAAGLAAAWAAAEARPVSDIDGVALREALVARGAGLLARG